MKQRYAELDAIRGIAILMVALYHYTVRYGEIYGYSIAPIFSFNIGQYGVQLFFIVSGFVIFLTLDKTEHPIDFIISRLSRLFPAYWVAIALTFSMVYLFSLPGREVDLKTAIIDLTMLQKWLKINDVDGVYWTLSVELSFYFIMFSLFISKQIKSIEIYSISWLSAIILFHYLEKYYSIKIPDSVESLFIFNYASLFIAGIMFYKITQKGKLIHYLVLSLALLTEYILYNELALLIGLYFIIFLAFSKNFLSYLSIKPLVFIGTISYSLYLIHQNIGYIIIRDLQLYNIATSFTIIVIPLVISIFIATLMYHYIEKPGLALIRNNWKSGRLRIYLISKLE